MGVCPAGACTRPSTGRNSTRQTACLVLRDGSSRICWIHSASSPRRGSLVRDWCDPGGASCSRLEATLRARVDAIRARSTPMTSTRSSAASERARARQRHRRHGRRRRARQHERHARRRRASRAARRVSATSQRSRRSHSRRHVPVAVRLLPRTSSSEDIAQREQRRSHARRWAGRAEGHALGRSGSRPAHSPRSPPPVSPARRPCSNSAER
jgi:hypothetical protein